MYSQKDSKRSKSALELLILAVHAVESWKFEQRNQNLPFLNDHKFLRPRLVIPQFTNCATLDNEIHGLSHYQCLVARMC